MSSGNWKDTAELLGIAAIVASLIFVGLELRQSQRIAFAEQEGSQVADFMALDELTSSNAGLILKVNRGDDLTDIELAEARILTGTLSRSHFFLNQRAAYLGHQSAGVPVMAIALTLFENPGLRKLWIDKTVADAEFFTAMRDRPGSSDTRQFFLDVQGHLATLDQLEGSEPQ